MSRLYIVPVAYMPLHPMLSEELKSVIEEFKHCGYEQHGDESRITDPFCGILPALVENGLMTQKESDEFINGSATTLVFKA